MDNNGIVTTREMPPGNEIALSVSDFVALLNQTLEFAYPSVTIVGELANLRVSKNRWLYFDLKDEQSSVKFFGTIYNLPGPLEDGLLLKVRGQPRLHNLFGFSVNIQSIQPAGEGSIKRAAQLLQAKLQAEGLFDESRKRPLPYPPQRVGLITSAQSAAYADFIKIVDARWQGLRIELIDVQVQGEAAPEQIAAALEQFNAQAAPPEVLVVIRGGGSAEDLAAFSTEMVTRAVAASRVPTLVAIGHEIDLSLTELAADRQASTPSNAAELLVPDRAQVLTQLCQATQLLTHASRTPLLRAAAELRDRRTDLYEAVSRSLAQADAQLSARQQLLRALAPGTILERGYAIIRQADGRVVRSRRQVAPGDIVDIQVADGRFGAAVREKGKA